MTLSPSAASSGVNTLHSGPANRSATCCNVESSSPKAARLCATSSLNAFLLHRDIERRHVVGELLAQRCSIESPVRGGVLVTTELALRLLAHVRPHGRGVLCRHVAAQLCI